MTSEESNESPAPEPPPAYRTKTVQFLGRSTPIILQNDNGPCPLLAICNVLLLRNSLNLVPETPEVPLQRLLSLVAEKLIDSNSHIQDKDDEYAINQQQNIADAIDLLPRLATGIDVNVQFRKIKDFEFTRECAIFDLLDIGLYHGWILDPQDTDTTAAIGSKSYNVLVSELVSFDTNRLEGEDNGTVIEDSIDFAAATTAALGVPSPCLSRGRSFDDCQGPVPMGKGSRKGDKEEEEELMRALNLSKGSRKGDKEEEEELMRALNLSKASRKGDKVEEEELMGALDLSKASRKGDKEEEEELMRALDLSKADISSAVHVSMSPDTDSSPILEGNTHMESSEPENHADSVEQIAGESEKSEQPDSYAPQKSNMSSDFKDDDLHSKYPSTENYRLSTNTDDSNKMDQLVSEGSEDFVTSSDLAESVKIDFLVPNPAPSFLSANGDGSDGCYTREGMTCHREDQSVSQTCTEDLFTSENLQSPVDNLTCCESAVCSDPVSQSTDLHSSNGIKNLPDVSEVGSSSLDEGEPIYEGEEHILDSARSKLEDREPVYEGEVLLAEQADNTEDDTVGSNPNNRLPQQQYQLIKNFLESSASQLTIYGLFCLQEGLKERELCVFFRNNHFSTMFKFNGELYLLATDLGYISQPDLVWEKLNEVNGDTVFMTGNFTEFMVENQVNDSWNEQNAIDSTADYIAKFESSEPTSSSLNSDYQLAVALQQKEFEQQPQHQQQQNTHESQVSGGSRLITGPQASRNLHAPQKNESKLKDKCTVM